jgi:LysM repeat protein
MTERGLPNSDGAPACPFVALEDERDERSSSPDHRHRCYAEVPPAPRALAHQEAYCLSSAFPVCPTFQDWARREAARERSEAAARATASGADAPAPEWRQPPGTGAGGLSAGRNPPRDWAAPPPWATGPGAAPRPEGRGLAGSPADRLAGGPAEPPPRPDRHASRAEPPDEELAGLVRGRRADPDADDERYLPPPAAPSRRQPAGPAHDRVPAERGPSWERPRRFEAYPTIKTRTGLPGIPRVAVMAAALVLAAVGLFFLPALLGIGGPNDPTSSPSASAPVATPTPQPTEPPAPTPTVYVIKQGDTLSKIARAFGVSLDDLLEANKATITNPNRISVGDQIIIPVPPPDEFVDPTATP